MVYYLRDPDRLNYTNKDLLAIDDDVTRYITKFIPTIKGMTIGNEGRMIIRIIEALVDMLHYSVDMYQRETNIEDVTQVANAMKVAKLVGYSRLGPSPSQVDCNFYMRQGTAPFGGTAIPLWTVIQKSGLQSVYFATTAAATIPFGESLVTGVPCVQGHVVTGETLTAAASGDPNQSYVVANAKVVADQVRVYVAATLWTKVDNFWDSGPADFHYTLTFDENDYATVTFGDGFFGGMPTAGSAITCDYIWTDGVGYDAGEAEIDTVNGAIAATVGVTNPLASTGAADGDDATDIKTKAPSAYTALWRAVTEDDILELSKDVAGVYSVKVKTPHGNAIDLYVLPVGGGTASAGLLSTLQTYLLERSVVQGDITCYSMREARCRITANIVAKNNRISKQVLYSWAYDAIVAAFQYDQFEAGYGYTISELSESILAVQDSTVFRSVDFTKFSRWPNVVQSNPAAPAMNGDVQISSDAGYDTWVLVATSGTAFQVMKNGFIEVAIGQVGVQYTPAGEEVTFTLGATTDVLTDGNMWTFKTSKLVGNLFVEEDEHMHLDVADLQIFIYYPGEYDSTT